jgi:putative nucleotidyltransferase with HDIG domain
MADQTLQTVRFDGLEPGMTIREVTELSLDYATLDDQRLQFLRAQFTGAKAALHTEQGRKVVPLADLKSKDSLAAILEIPPTLKIARVVQGLGPYMEKHGLLGFRVETPLEPPMIGFGAKGKPDPKGAEAAQPGTPEAKAQSQVKMAEVRKFLDTVAVASSNRLQASSMVEEMLDLGRAGQFTSKGVEKAVDEIVGNDSATAIKAIAGLKSSDQTYAHCTDMSVILQECYGDIMARTGKPTTEANRRFVLISGFMHDIGKSEVPKQILESTERFPADSEEMQIMRNHTIYGARILTEMGMHKAVINVAHYHHVKKDSTLYASYPDVSYADVLPITRLASIVDVYQALIGRRRYKRNWVPGKAIEYISNLKGSEFDDAMLEHFVESMGKYPVGSLVKLTTGDLAFVLMIAPRRHTDRPIVAVVESAKGELLTHHAMLDLMLEPEIRVQEVVDHYEHFNKSEDQAYQIFQSIQVGP